MKKLLALFLAGIFFLSALPAYALNLQVSSGTISADGLTVTLTMNDSSLTGSTSGCFSFSGNISPANISQSSAVLSGGSTVTITAAVPLMQGFSTSVVMAAFPTCAITGATQGVSAGQTVSLTNSSEYYPAGAAHWSSNFQYQGSPTNSTDGNGYPNTIASRGTNASIDFNLTSMGGTICVWSFNYNNALTLYEDGVPGSRNKLSSGTVYSQTCWTGLDTGTHSWAIVNSAAAPSAAYIEAIRISTPTLGAKPANLPIVSGVGASMMNIGGGGSAPDNTDTTQAGLLRQALGMVMQGQSYSGQNYVPTIENGAPSAMIPLGSTAPSIGILEPDSNDLFNGIALATYQTAIQTGVTNIMTNAAPPSHLIVFQPYAVSGETNSTTCNGQTVYQCVATYTPYIAAGIAAAGYSNVVLVHTNQLASGAPDWYNYLSVHNPCDNTHDTIDGIHACGATSLSGVGFAKITNRMIPFVYAALYSTSSFSISGGSTGGHVGTTSAAFTASLPQSSVAGVGNATWVDPVTINSSVGTDTLCIVGGSCGTGSVTLPVSTGTNTFQFTINPATVGARTISYTGLADAWVAPSSNSYTASLNGGEFLNGNISMTGSGTVQ